PPSMSTSRARVIRASSSSVGSATDMNAPVTTPVAANVACPVCGEATQVVFKDLYDDRYGYPDAFTLYECGACGHMHIPTDFTPDDLGRLYTQYYPRGNFDLDNFQPERDR